MYVPPTVGISLTHRQFLKPLAEFCNTNSNLAWQRRMVERYVYCQVVENSYYLEIFFSSEDWCCKCKDFLIETPMKDFQSLPSRKAHRSTPLLIPIWDTFLTYVKISALTLYLQLPHRPSHASTVHTVLQFIILSSHKFQWYLFFPSLLSSLLFLFDY